MTKRQYSKLSLKCSAATTIDLPKTTKGQYQLALDTFERKHEYQYNNEKTNAIFSCAKLYWGSKWPMEFIVNGINLIQD